MRRDPNARLVYSTGGVVRPQDEAEAPRTGGGRIRIHLDRRASSRVVTVVTGLSGSRADVAALCKALKAACGTGGTVKEGVLELQGDHRDKVEAALAARGLRSRRAGG